MLYSNICIPLFFNQLRRIDDYGILLPLTGIAVTNQMHLYSLYYEYISPLTVGVDYIIIFYRF